MTVLLLLSITFSVLTVFAFSKLKFVKNIVSRITEILTNKMLRDFDKIKIIRK